MSPPLSAEKKTLDIICLRCDENGYQYNIERRPGFIRLNVSNLSDKININVYNTGNFVVQGKKSILRSEFTEFKEQFDGTDSATSESPFSGPKPHHTTYTIISDAIRDEIKKNLKEIGNPGKIEDNPNADINYRYSVFGDGSKITITQYNTGTLLLQGKNDYLFDQCCSLIEKTVKIDTKDVIGRFVSENEDKKVEVIEQCTPELLVNAEKNVRSALGGAFDFLEVHDQNYLISSECLRMCGVCLPEYSPLVMPAAKGYEGFVKKLVISIGLVGSDYFTKKSGNFSPLSDTNNPNRQNLCAKQKHCGKMLNRVNLNLDIYRNFMMHSEGISITEVESFKKAETKINTIFLEISELFEYFDGNFNISHKMDVVD